MTEVKGGRPDAPATQAKVYDLEERTARFAESAISFAEGISKTPVTAPLVS